MLPKNSVLRPRRRDGDDFGDPVQGHKLVNAILLILRAKKVRCLLCATTARAAGPSRRRPASRPKTVHRLLEVNPASGGFTRNEARPPQCDLLKKGQPLP